VQQSRADLAAELRAFMEAESDPKPTGTHRVQASGRVAVKEAVSPRKRVDNR
jgi:hypothetical protein